MVKGKHGAQAATRRAESAEMQADRMAEQMVRWKREALQNRSMAERVPGLERQVRELRATVGVPRDEHEAALEAVEQRCADQVDRLTEAFSAVFKSLAKWTVQGFDAYEQTHKNSPAWLSARLLGALRDLPRDVALGILAGLGVQRDDRRLYLEPGAASLARSAGHQQAVTTFAMARQLGLLDEEGRLPRALLPVTPGDVFELVVDADGDALVD